MVRWCTHGIITLLAQGLGIIIAVNVPTHILRSPIWLIIGSTGAYTLYSYKDWTGYFGGLGFATFLMSIVPSIIRDASGAIGTGKTYFLAFLTTVLLYLANVWTVAYAFVPGGVYLRERSDL